MSNLRACLDYPEENRITSICHIGRPSYASANANASENESVLNVVG